MISWEVTAGESKKGVNPWEIKWKIMHSLTLEKGGQRHVLFGLGKSVWCLQSAKDNWPIINKDSQELTRYYYVSTFSCRNKTIIWKERSNRILNYHFTSSDTHVWTKFAFTAHDRFFEYVQQSLSRYSKVFCWLNQ